MNGGLYDHDRTRQEAIDNNNDQFTSKSDSEIAIHLYRKYDLKFVNYLRGELARTMYDEQRKKLSLRIKPISTDSISFKDHHHFNEQSLFIRTNKFLEEKTRSYIVELQHNELVDDMDEIYSFFRQDHLLHDIQYDSIVNTEFDEEERQHLLKSLLSNLLSSLSDKKNKLHEMDVIQTIGYVP
ncbi:unnamed protein product [Rotaria sp. Silwood2]|nr:unnamed protein product [Rotaria sp. Silwood2]